MTVPPPDFRNSRPPYSYWRPGGQCLPSPSLEQGPEVLAARQNEDGGWPYTRGPSWTEPTAYAVMAMLATGRTEAASRGIAWLHSVERGDGGFAPQKSVAESTWVTGLAALLPPERLGEVRHRRAIAWLLHMTGQESTFLYRLRRRMLGHVVTDDQKYDGWPWFPGVAAWVEPTTVAILALRREHMRTRAAVLAQRLEQGRKFLLSRRCADGGWNYGGVTVFGVSGRSYPETTGMALAAFAGLHSRGIDSALEIGERYQARERSADGQNWLQLGLFAHKRIAPARPAYTAPCRTVREQAMRILVDEAALGRDWLFS